MEYWYMEVCTRMSQMRVYIDKEYVIKLDNLGLCKSRSTSRSINVNMIQTSKK